MKLLSLFMSILSLFFVTWMFSVWMNPERVCLNSPVVENLEIESPDGAIQKVPECFLLSRLVQPELEPANQELLVDIVRAIESLRPVTYLFLSEWTPVSVRLSFLQPFTLKTEHGKILLGAEHLRSNGLLEKVLFQEILQTSYPTSDRFALELVSDFFVSVANNKWIHVSVFPDQTVPSKNMSFLSHIVSFREYCFSDLKSVFHWDYCLNQNSLLDLTQTISSLNDITIWGLRSYLSYHLWDHYNSLPYYEKSEMVQLLFTHLKLDTQTYPSEVENLQQLADWATDYLWTFAKVKIKEHVELKTSLVLDLQELSASFADWLDFLPDKQTMQKHHMSEALVLSQGQVIHVPSYRHLMLEMKEVRTEYLILPTCKEHSFSELASYNAEKVIVLEGCRSENLNWERLLKSDLVVGNN